MKIEVLVSTMNLKCPEELIQTTNIRTPYIIINQSGKAENFRNECIFSYKEKGLSKSRNRAIEKAKADICVIADDDVKYVQNYEQIICNAYEKYPFADIIVFNIKSLNNERKVKKIWRKEN